MTPNRDDDWLDRTLRAQGDEHRAAYVDDDGFTARVMAALPPRIDPVPRWRRAAEIGLWVAAGAAAAFALPDAAIDVGREAYRLLAAQSVSLPQIGATLGALGVATWALAAWALRSD